MTELNAPADPILQACVDARNTIKSMCLTVQRYIVRWEPAPMPDNWGREPHPAATAVRLRRGRR